MVSFSCKDNARVTEFIHSAVWPKLRKINISKTNISELPFQNFIALQEFHATQAQIKNIPLSIVNCSMLKVLNVSSNPIVYVSPGLMVNHSYISGVGLLAELEVLLLNGTQIKEIPLNIVCITLLVTKSRLLHQN